MSNVKGTIEGLPSLNKRLRDLPIQIKKEISKAVALGAIDIQNDIRVSMRNTPRLVNTKYKRRKGSSFKKGTRIRKKGAEKMFHHPSLEGHPPAIDTGRLVSHVNYIVDLDGLGASIGAMDAATLEYAEPLEFGTSKMAARPWLQPAFKRNKKKVSDRIEVAVSKSIKRVSKKK
jgi:HK97 gp10 family phage protein